MRGKQLFAGPTGDYCRCTSVDLKVHCYSNPVDSESRLAQEHAHASLLKQHIGVVFHWTEQYGQL